MWMLLAAAASALIGGLTSWGVSAYNAKKQEEFNQENIELAQEQNQFNIENQWKMWNASNEYNTPRNQMLRYEEAGLNPNLIYGQTNTAAPISLPSQATPQGQAAPKFDPSNLSQFISMIKDLPGAKADLDLKKASAKNAQIQNDILSEELIQKQMDTVGKRVQMNKDLYLLDHAEEYINTWFEGEIANAKSPVEKNNLIKAQARLFEVKETLSNLEVKFHGGDVDEAGYDELRLEAMRLANTLQHISVDWAEIEKSIGSASRVSQIFLSLLRNFLK